MKIKKIIYVFTLTAGMQISLAHAQSTSLEIKEASDYCCCLAESGQCIDDKCPPVKRRCWIQKTKEDCETTPNWFGKSYTWMKKSSCKSPTNDKDSDNQ